MRFPYEKAEKVSENTEWKMALLREASGRTPEMGKFGECFAKLAGLLQREEIQEQDIDGILVDFEKALTVSSDEGGERGAARVTKCKKGRSAPNHNKRNAFCYTRHQNMYDKCPRRLVDMAIDGRDQALQPQKTLPNASDIEGLYNTLWGVDSKNAILPEGDGETVETSIVFAPVTLKEVTNRVGRIKSKTAPGLDGIKKCHLTKSGALAFLTKFFNLLLAQEYYPDRWRSIIGQR